MILQLFIRFLQRIATPMFFIFWLLMGVLGSVAYGLSLEVRGLTFGALFWLALIGLTLGWSLAKTRLNTWLGAALLAFSGAGILFIWVGRLVRPVLNYLNALYQLGLAIGWAYLKEVRDFVADFAPVQLALSEISLNLKTLQVDLLSWLGSFSSGKPFFYTAAVFLTWGLAIWLVSAWAGWVHQRSKNVLLSILPGCVLLVTALGYAYTEPIALIPLLLSALLLIAFTWLYVNESRWINAKIDYPEGVRLDSILVFASISMILVTGAFFLPRLSLRKMVEKMGEIINPQIEQAAPFIESLGIEPYKPSLGRFGAMLSAGLPRSHLIGSGPELSQDIVMSVRITSGLPPEAEAADTIPLYWRGLTYDRYTGNGWESSDVTLRHYRSNQDVGVFERPGYWIVEQEVEFREKSELLFAAGDLISVDENYQVAWRSEPWLSEIEQYPGDIFGSSTDERSYRAQTFVPIVDENTLRATSYDYPVWIREHYTLIPLEMPPRIINFTRNLIEGVDNPYDRARLIEQYLRQFEYTTDVPLPPTDRDLVDYFLFDLKKGYCDYFASAMVLMARSADLPARLVVGYGRGTYDSANHRYVVTEANAHSWPEIYFSGIGWVPFEPTSGVKAIARAETPLQFPGDAIYVIEAESLMGGIKPLFGSWLLTFGIVTLVVIWFGMVWITLDEWWLKRLSPAAMSTRLYRRLYQHGRRLGVSARKEDTAYDFAASLRRQFASLEGKSPRRKSVRQARRDILSLTDIFARVQFSPSGSTAENQKQILIIWQRLRRQLLLARGLFWFKKLKPRNWQRTRNNIGENHE